MSQTHSPLLSTPQISLGWFRCWILWNSCTFNSLTVGSPISHSCQFICPLIPGPCITNTNTTPCPSFRKPLMNGPSRRAWPSPGQDMLHFSWKISPPGTATSQWHPWVLIASQTFEHMIPGNGLTWKRKHVGTFGSTALSFFPCTPNFPLWLWGDWNRGNRLTNSAKKNVWTWVRHGWMPWRAACVISSIPNEQASSFMSPQPNSGPSSNYYHENEVPTLMDVRHFYYFNSDF